MHAIDIMKTIWVKHGTVSGGMQKIKINLQVIFKHYCIQLVDRKEWTHTHSSTHLESPTATPPSE